jgi:glycosyltransferase involved in cell wall biosynthesis
MNRPLISVIVLTYNHERYIKECLNGILSQDYSNFEVIVSDDASTDNSLRVIEEVNDPDKRIKVFQTEENLGPAGNFRFALNQCHGDYIAICEGDDVWIDERKLTLQFFALSSGRTVSLVYADYTKINDSGETLKSGVLSKQPDSYEIGDLIDLHGPTTNSILFKKDSLPEKLPGAFFEVLNPDVFIIGYCLVKGKSIYLPEVLSAHREHDKGIWTSLDKFKRGLYRYSTLMKFYRAVGNTRLEKKAADLLERQVILAKERDDNLFNKFYRELPLKRRSILNLKWGYSRIKNPRT